MHASGHLRHSLPQCKLGLDASEVACVMGPSGIGKSTLLKIVNDMLAPAGPRHSRRRRPNPVHPSPPSPPARPLARSRARSARAQALRAGVRRDDAAGVAAPGAVRATSESRTRNLLIPRLLPAVQESMGARLAAGAPELGRAAGLAARPHRQDRAAEGARTSPPSEAIAARAGVQRPTVRLSDG